MILLDKPYVSEFLRNTLISNKIPVIDIENTRELLDNSGILFVSQTEAIDKIKQDENIMLYTNSENSIDWIETNLHFSHFPKNNALFKNKIVFRNILKSINPNYFYKGISFDEIDNLDISPLPFPFIIKPAVGFFSLGVNKVEKAEDWKSTKKKIKKQVEEIENIYPTTVLNSSEFIIEECIEGEEFAIDCYYNEKGEAVVLFIMQHWFASGSDVGDRIYYTSKKVIQKNLPSIQRFLEDLGELTNLKNYPIHVEVRIDENNKVMPIEVNPMRFGGWCTSAELANHAFGINTYEHLFNKTKPDWNEILKLKNHNITSIIILDNSVGHTYKNCEHFDYNKLLSEFEKPLELRKVDYSKFHIFGFLYCETAPENIEELDRILKSDLQEYLPG